MALYSCKKHGLTGTKMVCSHAEQGVRTGVPIQTTIVEVGDLLIPVMRLCAECLASWQGLSIEEDRETFLESIVPICGKCFDEADMSLRP